MGMIAVIDTETNWEDAVMSIGVVVADGTTFTPVEVRYLVLDPEAVCLTEPFVWAPRGRWYAPGAMPWRNCEISSPPAESGTSMLRNVIPSQIRIAAYIVIIAAFVTIVDLLLQALLPDLSESLGVFIPLIVVNCIVLGRAEAFASKNGVLASAVDGLCQGIGYTVALVIMCVIREFLGSGTFGGGILGGGEGIRIIPEGYPAMQMVMPVGGFLTLGFLIAFFQWMMKRIAAKQKEAAKK